MSCDFLVVGNGPAGCIAASNASASGETILVGSNERRMQCAGLVSVSGLERLGINPKDTVLNTVRGARIYSPSGNQVLVDAKKDKAYVLDRLAFDGMLLDAALASGVEYVDGWVTSLKPMVEIKGRKPISAGMAILASGTDYTLHHRNGLETPGEYLVGGQYEMKVDCDMDYVELHFNTPDFFSWVIPLGETARVGLCVKGNPRPYLDSFVKRLKSQGRLKSGKITSQSFGIIPLHRPSMRTEYEGLRLVGDSAGQVKASTGGGVVMGGLAARHITSPDYGRLWRKEIGLELRLHLMIHRMLNRLSDKGKDRFFRVVGDSHASLERSGDMDMASKTLSSLAKDPSFIAKVGLNLPWLLLEMF